jgi:hypothetical protein
VPGQTSQAGSCRGTLQVTATAPEPAEVQKMDRARFSGTRFAVELLAGGAAGLLTSLTLCNGSSCPGDGFVAFGVDLAVTPLVIWGIGGAMGGRGSLMYSYVGASVAVTPLSMPGSPDEAPIDTINRINTEVAISAVLLPICSAVLYEASSHFTSVRWRNEHAPQIALRPLNGRDGLNGGLGTLSLRF